MDDLDPDGRLAEGAVEEPADLEAADAQPLAHLVLGQVQPVVELGCAKHEARLARQRLAGARGRLPGRCSSGGDRDAQMCSRLLMCCSRYADTPSMSSGPAQQVARRDEPVR